MVATADYLLVIAFVGACAIQDYGYIARNVAINHYSGALLRGAALLAVSNALAVNFLELGTIFFHLCCIFWLLFDTCLNTLRFGFKQPLYVGKTSAIDVFFRKVFGDSAAPYVMLAVKIILLTISLLLIWQGR